MTIVLVQKKQKKVIKYQPKVRQMGLFKMTAAESLVVSVNVIRR